MADCHLDDKWLNSVDQLHLVTRPAGEQATRDAPFVWTVSHYDTLVKGIFESRLPEIAATYCSVEKATLIERVVGPKIEQHQAGGLALDRSVEQVHYCGVLKQIRGADIARVLAEASLAPGQSRCDFLAKPIGLIGAQRDRL